MARLLFFASDMSEIAQIRRIRSLQQAGHAVSSISMTKGASVRIARPDWPNLDLGPIAEERLVRRAWRVLRSLPRLWRARGLLRDADLLIARNLDMVLLALVARRLAGCQGPVVYECLDIHAVLSGASTRARVLRWVERQVLRQVALLVVSSPGFLRGHFTMRQHYAGPHLVLENKLWLTPGVPPRPAADTIPRVTDRLHLAWVGAIRCRASLDLLLATAALLPDRLHIHIHGTVHRHAIGDLEARLRGVPNVTCHGPYDWPAGLARIYTDNDLVWAQDLWQRGKNSDWLLPNRLYEAGWFGCPAIACTTTQTGRKIVADGLGYTIDSPTPAALADLLASLDHAALAEKRAAILARPAEIFGTTGQEAASMVDDVLGARKAVAGQPDTPAR